jgi:ketosteroid isomerase-like protein
VVSAAALRDLQSAYHTWNARKGSTAEPFFQLMADDVKFRSISDGAPEMRFTRPHSGRQQVESYFEELARDWQMIFYHVRAFLVQDDTVAVVCECCWRHKQTGKIVHSPKHIVRYKDDKIADFFEFFDNEQAILACSGEVDPKRPAPKPLYPETDGDIIKGVTERSRANVQNLEALYKEWHDTKGKSVATIMNILAPQVTWGSLANGADDVPFTVTKLSKEEVGAYFDGLAAAFEMEFYKADEFLAAGDFVLMLGSCAFGNRSTGRDFHMPKADLWRFSNGKAVEFFEYYDTAAVLATTRAPVASASNSASA